MNSKIIEQLAPTGILRAGVSFGNNLLVSARDASGGPVGVAPDMAAEIAQSLGVDVEYVLADRPSGLPEHIASGACDISFLGADPARADMVAFTPPYCEIPAAFLVPADSTLTVATADTSGTRIASVKAAAYDIWLDGNYHHATLVKGANFGECLSLLQQGEVDAVAGLRAHLAAVAPEHPSLRLLNEDYMRVQQAVGTAPGKPEALAYLTSFVETAKQSGLVARLIAKHGVSGLTVAP